MTESYGRFRVYRGFGEYRREYQLKLNLDNQGPNRWIVWGLRFVGELGFARDLGIRVRAHGRRGNRRIYGKNKDGHGRKNPPTLSPSSRQKKLSLVRAWLRRPSGRLPTFIGIGAAQGCSGAGGGWDWDGRARCGSEKGGRGVDLRRGSEKWERDLRSEGAEWISPLYIRDLQVTVLKNVSCHW